MLIDAVKVRVGFEDVPGQLRAVKESPVLQAGWRFQIQDNNIKLVVCRLLKGIRHGHNVIEIQAGVQEKLNDTGLIEFRSVKENHHCLDIQL